MARRVPLPVAASAFGVAFLAGVVSATLRGATYRADVETICNGESESGLRMSADMARVTQWIYGRLRTPRGGQLFARLRDQPLDARAGELRARAREVALDVCPMARSYESLEHEARYRLDVQRLCSRLTFPSLSDLPPSERVQRLEEWIDAEAATEETRALAAPLGQAPGGPQQGSLLRRAAFDAGVLTCDVARDIEEPPAKSCP